MKGFIFRCNNKTKDEVFERMLFGEETVYLDLIRAIDASYSLFLYNTQTFEFTGPYKPVSKGELEIEKGAWGGAFKAQIRFEGTEGTKTVTFSKIEKVIKEYRRNIFPYPLLDKEQVKKILTIQNQS